MNRNMTGDSDEMVAADEESERYSELYIGDEEFVVYDRENCRAWIQSSSDVVVKVQR